MKTKSFGITTLQFALAVYLLVAGIIGLIAHDIAEHHIAALFLKFTNLDSQIDKVLSFIICTVEVASGVMLILEKFINKALFSAVSMIFVYGTQNGVLGLVFYILLGASVFDIIISAISLLPFLRDTDFNLGDYVISGMATKVVQASSFGTGALWFLAFLVFWVALPTFIAMQIFKNKELDF